MNINNLPLFLAGIFLSALSLWYFSKYRKGYGIFVPGTGFMKTSGKIGKMGLLCQVTAFLVIGIFSVYISFN